MPDDRSADRGGSDRPPGMPPSRRIPGDIGWKPDVADVERVADQARGDDGARARGVGPRDGGGSEPGLVLRILSVVPFFILGVVGAIGLAGWALIFVFGLGAQQPVWEWASGRPAGDVVKQVSLVLALGLACLAVAGAALWAGLYGIRAESGRVFWVGAEAFLGLLALAMVVVDWRWPRFADDLGLSDVEWWLLFAVVAEGLVTARLRSRATAGPAGDARRDAG